MVEYVIGAALAALVGIPGGGYLGYKYGRRVEVKARTAYEKLVAEIKASLSK